MRIWELLAAFTVGVVCAVSALAQTAAPTPEPATVGSDKAERYRIGFQDVIDIQVFRHADLSQRVAVSPTGTIVLFRLDHPVIAVSRQSVNSLMISRARTKRITFVIPRFTSWSLNSGRNPSQ